MRKKYWALPANAAEMKKYREISENTTEAATYFSQLSADGKQLILPISAGTDEYLNISPVTSCGLISEMWLRNKDEYKPTLTTWMIQPTPAAFANHGETLMVQSGRIRCFNRGLTKNKESGWRGDFVVATGTAYNVNISSGGIAVGFPAITQMGGYAHVLERATGARNLQFAMGFTMIDRNIGHRKGTRAERKVSDKTNNVIITDEITATCKFVIMIKSSKYDKAIAEELNTMQRFAGGSVFDLNVQIRKDSEAPDAIYLTDVSNKIKFHDTLYAAFNLFLFKGKWVKSEKNKKTYWIQQNRKYTVIHNGYAFLEEPQERKNVRNLDYKHVFAEPTFSIVRQSKMSSRCWWKRVNTEAGIFWMGV